MALRQSAIALIFNGRGELLLVKQGYGHKFYALPGGLIEDDESPQEAVLRETGEEIGVAAVVESLLGMYDVLFPGFPRTLVYVFHCSITEQPRVAQPEEIESVGWYSTSSFPEPIGPMIPGLVEDWLSGDRGLVRSLEF